ncbi:MAG: hypothetical protein ACM3N4_09565 [Nitrososphaerota archaeon]
MTRFWSLRSLSVFILALLVVSVAGCAGGASANGTTGTSGTGNATPTTASATSAPTSAPTTAPTTCSQVPGFAQAGPLPHAGAVLGSIPFPDPSNSLYTSLNQVAGGGPGLYLVELMQVCTPNTTVSTIHSHFASQVGGYGWTQSSTYPYDGGYQAPCGDPYCWSRTPQGPSFLSLEKVTAVGNGLVTYGIRIAAPPSTPDCSNIVPGGGTPKLEFFWSQQSSVPVPPLSVEGMYDGHQVGGKTVLSQTMCSPGTAASVKTFMSSELAKHGFTATSQSLCGTTGWVVKNNLAIAWTVNSATNWSLSYCQ